MPIRSRIARFAVVVAIFVFISQPAYAYIDPGTGSIVTSAILGFFAAIAYMFRKYMYRIKDLLFGKPSPVAKQKDR